MPKLYYRCSNCHYKVNFNRDEKYTINDEPQATRCENCNTIIRCYQWEYLYWWEEMYLTIRDIIRKLR